MLRGIPTVAFALLCLGNSGCSVWRYARLSCIEEPKLFCEREDDLASLATYQSWADEAWAETGACCPASCLEIDYAWGFREGFAQYVYAGGTGEPPAMPPRPYWQVDQRTAEGAAAVNSWFAGYRHGASVAREGGYRAATTVRLSGSLKDCDACGCPTDPANPPQEMVPSEPMSGPTFESPAQMPPPSEIIIPLQTRPTDTQSDPPSQPEDSSELRIPSLEPTPNRTTAPEAALTPRPRVELGGAGQPAARVTRVEQTALFEIVR
ncbi:hypothetical protein Pla108_32500 [Botrimarina colliarenosi]|uniref:Uncharacterized protein n=1 Tax=Botrimarina colliarenosi TaxID=2528001 RepID=A0A5C6AD41_9BACT|nr:hypothetical protein [Botrimarina colliarenosi]TWT96163.1 hypothetical protein Pla108_32500 [Botrimarina colliarenosi]